MTKDRLNLKIDQVDAAYGEYQIVTDSSRIVGRFPYKLGNETSRGVAHGRANIFRRELFSKINTPEKKGK